MCLACFGFAPLIWYKQRIDGMGVHHVKKILLKLFIVKVFEPIFTAIILGPMLIWILAHEDERIRRSS